MRVEVFIIWWLLSITVVVPLSMVLVDCCEPEAKRYLSRTAPDCLALRLLVCSLMSF